MALGVYLESPCPTSLSLFVCAASAVLSLLPEGEQCQPFAKQRLFLLHFYNQARGKKVLNAQLPGPS